MIFVGNYQGQIFEINFTCVNKFNSIVNFHNFHHSQINFNLSLLSSLQCTVIIHYWYLLLSSATVILTSIHHLLLLSTAAELIICNSVIICYCYQLLLFSHHQYCHWATLLPCDLFWVDWSTPFSGACGSRCCPFGPTDRNAGKWPKGRRWLGSTSSSGSESPLSSPQLS